GNVVMVLFVMWHILFSSRIAAREQRHDMPPLRGHHQLLAISHLPSIVRQHIKTRQVRPTGNGSLEGAVYASGIPLPLKLFRPKQFKWGVRVKLWNETRRLEGMFIYAGHYRSGKFAAGGHVFQRVTTKPLPIQLQTGPAVPTEMVKDRSKDVFEETVAEMLPRRVAHEIGRLLPD
ncbi:hypothetical protein, partial [Cochlodiniinecator piscidefendens]|uniref:hypothetical protein n=1 Tax=Cochlodiniinecator piscidefendens TaxID=2715756 RepID=UPI0038B3F9CD